jgi:uncharacterized membrane protein YwzB
MNNAIIVAVSLATAVSLFLITYTDAFAALHVQRLNSFYVKNETTEKPLLMVLGQFINNGTKTQPEVDISLTLFDDNNKIVGVFFQYNYDVKVGDTLPFRFRVNPTYVQDNNLSNINNYTIIAE